MNCTKKILSGAAVLGGLILLGAAPGLAAADELDDALDRELAVMATADGAGYVAARDRLVALGAPARDRLAARLQGAAWSDASWRTDALAAAAHAWLADPVSAAKVTALRGVDPREYGKWRRPEPETYRDLRPLAGRVAPVLVEVYTKTFSVYAFAPREAYGEETSDAKVAEMAKAERLALREGLLLSLGHSDHPVAARLLDAVLADASAPDELRRDAAVGLGGTAAPFALARIAAIATDAESSELVRGGCLRGAGRIRTEASLDLLARFVGQDGPAALRPIAIASIGSLGSSWAFGARANDEAVLALRGRAAALLARTLVAEAAGGRGEELDGPLVEALAVVAHAAGVDALREAEAEMPTDAARERVAAARERVETSIARAAR